MTRKQMMKTYTANPDAYQDYLQSPLLVEQLKFRGLNKSDRNIFQASDCYQGSRLRSWLIPDWPIATMILQHIDYVASDRYPKARRKSGGAMKASEIDDTLAEAHTSLAFVKHVLRLGLAGR